MDNSYLTPTADSTLFHQPPCPAWRNTFLKNKKVLNNTRRRDIAAGMKGGSGEAVVGNERVAEEMENRITSPLEM